MLENRGWGWGNLHVGVFQSILTLSRLVSCSVGYIKRGRHIQKFIRLSSQSTLPVSACHSTVCLDASLLTF